MAINRPSKPSATLPNDFGGVQTPYTSAQISSGYQDGVPQVVDGGNMNYERKGLFQGMKYLRTVVDFIRDTPIGKIFWINSNGQMDYMTPAVIATDTEYTTGTATDKTPNVKQVVDNLALKADDNSAVHKNGNEIIYDTKTFVGGLIRQLSTGYGGVCVQNSTIAKGTTPSTTVGGQFVFQDKDGISSNYRIGGIEVEYNKNGSILTRLTAYKPENSSSTYAYIGVVYPANGQPYTEAPTPTEDTNTSKQIDTVGARNTKLANYLPLSGGTLTGNLTITKNAPNVILRNTEITKGTGASKLTPMNFNDKDGKSMGVVRHQYGTNKNSIMELLAYKANANSDTQAAALSITYPASGDPYAKAPASDEDGSIVTTVSKTKASNGGFKLGNGLIINWGTYGTGSGSATITYSMPYTSAPKIFAGNNYNSTGAFPGFADVGTTSCKINKNSGISGWWFAIGY